MQKHPHLSTVFTSENIHKDPHLSIIARMGCQIGAFGSVLQPQSRGQRKHPNEKKNRSGWLWNPSTVSCSSALVLYSHFASQNKQNSQSRFHSRLEGRATSMLAFFVLIPWIWAPTLFFGTLCAILKVPTGKVTKSNKPSHGQIVFVLVNR